MSFLQLLGIIVVSLIAIFTAGYITAVIAITLPITRKIICKRFNYNYNGFTKQSNTSDDCGSQRKIFKAITEYVKYYPIALYSFYWDCCLRGKPIQKQRANKATKSDVELAPNPVDVEIPERIKQPLHIKCIISKLGKRNNQE